MRAASSKVMPATRNFATYGIETSPDSPTTVRIGGITRLVTTTINSSPGAIRSRLLPTHCGAEVQPAHKTNKRQTIERTVMRPRLRQPVQKPVWPASRVLGHQPAPPMRLIIATMAISTTKTKMISNQTSLRDSFTCDLWECLVTPTHSLRSEASLPCLQSSLLDSTLFRASNPRTGLVHESPG